MPDYTPNPKKTKAPPPPRASASTGIISMIVGKILSNRVRDILLVLLVLFALIQPHLILSNFSGRERVIIYDPTNPESASYTVTTMMDFKDAKAMHADLVRDAIRAGWSLNPKGYDELQKVNMLFLEKAKVARDAEIAAEAAEFRSKNFHQKVEIGGIDIASTDDKIVVAVAQVQLIRTGIVNNSPIVDVKKIRIRLELVRNPDMYINRRYPLAVWTFATRSN